MLIMLLVNFTSSITYFSILSPMIMARTSNNRMILAAVKAFLGIGGVSGSLLVTGMALMFVLNGILGVMICISGCLLKDIRSLERDLPDFDMIPQ